MVFHPLHQWPTRGPFTPLIKTFLGSGMQLSSKISVFAYICSCEFHRNLCAIVVHILTWSLDFAIGVGLPMTVLNYFLVGWFDDSLDHFYLPSWKVFVSNSPMKSSVTTSCHSQHPITGITSGCVQPGRWHCSCHHQIPHWRAHTARLHS